MWCQGTRLSIVGVSLVAGYLLVTGGCQTPKRYAWLKDVGRQIDDVAKGLEEYGTISISSPLLASPSETFEFGLKRDALDYFNEAKSEIHGQAALFTQESVDTRLGLKAGVNLAQLLKNVAELKEYRDDLAAFKRKQALKDLGMSLKGAQTVIEALNEIKRQQEAEEEGGEGGGEDESEPVGPRAPLEILLEALGDAATGVGEGLSGEDTRPAFPDLGTDPDAETDSSADDDADGAADPNEDGQEEPAGGVIADAGVLPERHPAQDVFASDKFTKFMKLLGNEPAAGMSNRAAIITAAGDKATEAMLRFLGNPAEAMKFKDKAVLFGVSMVSVNPGHRTYRGYAADISVTVEFEYTEARLSLIQLLQDKGDASVQKMIAWVKDAHNGSAPSTEFGSDGLSDPPELWAEPEEGDIEAFVAAVSPMTETQALDLQSSLRKQKAYAVRIALALSGLGLDAQSQIFRDWVERIEQDVATRSAFNAVTAYSNSGAIFGFQITPRLKALSDPSSEKARPDMILDPLTFPVLVIIGIDREHLLRIRDIDSSCPIFVEPAIRFRQTSRWLPVGNPVEDKRFLGRCFDRCSKPRLKEETRMEWARKLYAASDAVEEYKRSDLVEAKRRIKRNIRVVEKLIRLGKARAPCGTRPKTGGVHIADLERVVDELQELQQAYEAFPDRGEEERIYCAVKGLKALMEKNGKPEASAVIDGGDAADLEAALQILTSRLVQVEEEESDSHNEELLARFASNRIDVLDYFALDSWYEQPLPESVFIRHPGVPQVAHVVPPSKVVDPDKPGTLDFYLLGKNLSRLVTDAEKIKLRTGQGKVTQVEHVGNNQLLLRFQPEKLKGKGMRVVFGLPFRDAGELVYIQSPEISLEAKPAKTPSVSQVVPLEMCPASGAVCDLSALLTEKLTGCRCPRPGDHKLTIMLIGSDLKRVKIDEIRAENGTGTVTNPRLANGVIYFEFDPKRRPVPAGHVFCLPYELNGQDKCLKTPQIVVAPSPRRAGTTKWINREVSKHRYNQRERVEFSKDVAPGTVQTFIRPAATQPTDKKANTKEKPTAKEKN